MRVIYIDIDSCRPDHLGCYGYHRATSPNIDQLARESVRFTNVYTSDAPCLPSRTALFGGRLGLHNGVNGHGGTAARVRYPGDGHTTDPERLPLPMALSRAGIKTVTFTTFGQRHLAWHFYAGWDEIHKPNNKNGNETADEVNAAVLPWLEANGKQDNYFLHVNYWDPHTPYRTPLGFGNPFANEPPPAWPTQEVLDAQWASYGMHGAHDKPPHSTAQYPRIPAALRTRADYHRWIDGYDCGVRFADEHIGQLIQTLDRLGVLDETAIIVSADHGEAQGELNVYGDHQCADQATCNVPLLIRWPKVSSPRRYDGLMYQLDLAPTVCELLGVPVPGRWDGRSFADAVRGTEDPGRSFVVLSQGAWTCQRAVRTENWLEIRTYHTGNRPFPAAMLFDLAEDRRQEVNRAADRPEVVARLDRILQEWWQANLSGADAAPDPLITIIQEGGPWYVRNRLDEYVQHLRETGREAAAKELAELKGRPLEV